MIWGPLAVLLERELQRRMRSQGRRLVHVPGESRRGLDQGGSGDEESRQTLDLSVLFYFRNFGAT